MGTVNVTEAVIIAVHTLLNKLRKWLDITEGSCGVLFAQTQLSLYKCICMEEELASQLRESNPEQSLEFEMVREISSLAEQVLRTLSTRFTLSKMLLVQLSDRSGTQKEVPMMAPITDSLSLQRPSKRLRDTTTTTKDNHDRDDITEIISLYSQSCRSISSFTKSRKQTTSGPNSARRRKSSSSTPLLQGTSQGAKTNLRVIARQGSTVSPSVPTMATLMTAAATTTTTTTTTTTPAVTTTVSIPVTTAGAASAVVTAAVAAAATTATTTSSTITTTLAINTAAIDDTTNAVESDSDTPTKKRPRLEKHN
jgi:hypothetical protein